jgi:hypothetical protein
MARKQMTRQELREHFQNKGGRIILHTHNNIIPPFLVGLAERHTDAPPKTARETTSSVEMRLALINWADEGPDPTPEPNPDPVVYDTYHRLDRVPDMTKPPNPDPVPATYGEPFPDPGALDEPQADYWFEQSFRAENIPDGDYLLDFILNYVDDGALDPPTSYITEVTAEKTSDKIDTNQLLSLDFGGNSFAHDEGQYDFDEGTGEGEWDGWAWMYFIGTPQAPVYDQPQPYGDADLPDSSFPGLGLGEYTVSRLNGTNPPPPEPQGVGNGIFTLCYGKSRFSFTAETTTENGETVHRVHCKHVGKQSATGKDKQKK